jgi:5-methylcytosine-specific restriction endonuclease McrA
MISIKRTPIPDFLADPDGAWQVETDNAIAHYTAAHAGSFDFKMYNDSRLKDKLKEVFKKCAYCESSYGAVYDGDVEHFRPKGKVSEKNPQTPGYYWLANDWDNLLLSCQHCNQRRRHQLEPDAALESLGKLDQFPLSDEAKRAADHTRSIADEDDVRLLLNPCKDDPTKHFEYENTAGVIVPLTEMAKHSVDVYALRRPLLVQERKKQLILLFTQMERVKRELERYNQTLSAVDRSVFDTEMDFLIEFTKPESIYSGMCRFFVRKFIAENGL